MQWSRHDAYSLMLPRSLHKPALSSWSNGDRTMRCACRSLQNVTHMTNSSLAPLYRSRRGVFLRSSCYCAAWGRARREMQRSGPGAVSREAIPSIKPLTLLEKNPQHALVRSGSRRIAPDARAPLPADLFTAVIYHHACTPHTVRIPAGAAASAPARAGTACQAREHTGTRDGDGE